MGTHIYIYIKKQTTKKTTNTNQRRKTPTLLAFRFSGHRSSPFAFFNFFALASWKKRWWFAWWIWRSMKCLDPGKFDIAMENPPCLRYLPGKIGIFHCYISLTGVYSISSGFFVGPWKITQLLWFSGCNHTWCWNSYINSYFPYTPPRFNVAPEKLLSYWKGNFSGATLNFGRVYAFQSLMQRVPFFHGVIPTPPLFHRNFGYKMGFSNCASPWKKSQEGRSVATSTTMEKYRKNHPAEVQRRLKTKGFH